MDPPMVHITSADLADSSSDQRTTPSGAIAPEAGAKGAARMSSLPGRVRRSLGARRRRMSPMLPRS